MDRLTLLPVSVVYPSGQLSLTADQKMVRHEEMKSLGFFTKSFEPENASENGYSCGTALERALLLSQALTDRKSATLWAARGGFGASETIPFLENLLPPALPPKTLVGFSDVSFLGNYLFQRYPNFNYIHANNFFDPKLLKGSSEWERSLLLNLISTGSAPRIHQPLEWFIFETGYGTQKDIPKTIEGACIPLNMALAAVLSSVPGFKLSSPNIIFLEDINENTFRLLRLADQMLLAGLFDNTKAVILGEFQNCFEGNEETLQNFGRLLSKKTHLPVFGWEAFGHGKNRVPLVTGSSVSIVTADGKAKMSLSYESHRVSEGASVNALKPIPRHSKIHFIGIGGTGMASVAGLAKAQGHLVSGSDNPIYPPMNQTLLDLKITPAVGFRSENLQVAQPDMVVLANVVSRRNAELQPNLEFDALTKSNLPVFSFPSYLRHQFLSQSTNVVVAGTHGKTTTTSLLAHVFAENGLSPSFMVGGRPKNFGVGFDLKNPRLFVLEGDEYDSALFDKGPKFLHYEPAVALINNIEFDHADIYPNIEAIEKEFYRYAQLCSSRNGILVTNSNCPRSAAVARSSIQNADTLGITFGAKLNKDSEVPDWCLVAHSPIPTGLQIEVQTPWGEVHSTKVALFGPHNALNALGALASAHARAIFDSKTTSLSNSEFSKILKTKGSFPLLQSSLDAMASFQGVERRFEHVGTRNGVHIYDDFAHHPTAINTTLKAFKDHLKSLKSEGRLVACFDPRNATMRRSVLQKELSESFGNADLVRIGKLPIDKRLTTEELLNPKTVTDQIGPQARYFEDNNSLLACLKDELKSGDLVVFMSSGAFDNCPRNLLEML
jgi:UDP-N-acetylmuramate: L-alanyl-gamma-D-glutamyl-meso-diaminopimelate ligase